MVYNIDFAAALKAAGTNAGSKATSLFEGRREIRSSDFKDNLSEAVRKMGNVSGSREPEPKRETVKLQESKPFESRKTDKKLQEQDRDKEKADEKQGSKLNNILGELMQMLDELSKLQQAGPMTVDKQSGILQNINNLLGELDAELVEAKAPLTQNGLMDMKSVMAAVEKLTAEVREKGGNMAKGSELSDLKAQIKELLSKNETAEADKQGLGIEWQNIEGHVQYKDKQAVKPLTDSKMSEGPQVELMETQPDAKELENKAAAGNKERSAMESAEKQAAPEIVQVDSNNKNVSSKPQDKQDIEAELKNAVDGKLEKTASEEAKSGSGSGKEEQQQEAPRTEKTAVRPTENKNASDMTANFKLEAPANEKLVQEMADEGYSERTQAPQKADVINQIVKKAELIIREDQPEMRMQLEPENLGKLTLKVAVERGLITAKFVAESYEVKQIIESNFNHLKDMLQEKGIGVESFSVSVGHESREFNKENSRHLWQESYKPSSRRSTGSEGYGSYVQGDLQAAVTKNPYSYHDGKFDYRA